MNQEEFSKLAEEYIRRHYSDSVQKLAYKDDGAFDCLIPSKKGLLFIWIATYDREITVGFEDADGNSDSWHHHIPKAERPEEELIEMSQLIDSIRSDSDPIVYDLRYGYRLTDDLDTEKRRRREGESITICKWSEI